MLANTTHLKGLVIRATDGEIGTVDQLYFDDESWAIRYLTVKTGSWLEDREVLISPFSVTNVDWPAKRLDVELTKKQVKDSPSIDTQRPVSRQYETEYLGYYGYPNYWNGSYLWGEGTSPERSAGGKDPESVDGLASTQYWRRHRLSHRGYGWRNWPCCRILHGR